MVPILKGVAEVNPTVKLLLGLLNPPDAAPSVRRARARKRRAAQGRLERAPRACSARGARGQRVRLGPRRSDTAKRAVGGRGGLNAAPPATISGAGG